MSLPAAPEWLDRMESGQWYRVSGDTPDLGLLPTPKGTRYLIDNDPAADPAINPARTLKERLRRALGRRPRSNWHGQQGFRAITEAWNGAVFASKFGACGSMIVFGGGHDDYFGSDVHAFDLATRRWSRISDGYVAGGVDAYGAGAVYPSSTYPDGSPLPPHTYDYVQYDPVGNDLLLLKGQTELGPSVKAVAIGHMFNLTSLSWRRGPAHPTAILNSGGWTTWDAARRILWGHSGDDGGGNAFIGLAPDGDNGDGTWGRWTEHYPSKLPGAASGNAMQIDPVRDRIAVAAHRANCVYLMDPAKPGRPLERIVERGERPGLAQYGALEFAPALDALIYYSAVHGPDVFALRPPADDAADAAHGTWDWRLTSARRPMRNPIADAASLSIGPVDLSHTFGRFRVASYSGIDDRNQRKAQCAIELAILVRHVDSPVYAMRLAAA